MDLQEHTTPEKLLEYSFLWSIARMVIAAVSLFFGAVPIAYKIIGGSITYSLIPIFWLISGITAGYLLYLWYTSGQKIFGGNEVKDKTAFFVMIVSGINLGYVGIASNNIGMSFVSGDSAYLIYKATAIVYLLVAFYLWKQWTANDKKLF